LRSNVFGPILGLQGFVGVGTMQVHFSSLFIHATAFCPINIPRCVSTDIFCCSFDKHKNGLIIQKANCMPSQRGSNLRLNYSYFKVLPVAASKLPVLLCFEHSLLYPRFPDTRPSPAGKEI
jgi:hypothetical protein